MPENILDLDVEPVQGLVVGNYLGWRVTTNRHAPQYEIGDILLTDREGRVAGHVSTKDLQDHLSWAAPSSSSRSASNRDKAPSPLRILIVEDDGVHALYLESHIRKLGYEVVDTVASGPQAIAAVAAHHPDIVFMDVKLAGDMDGIEAAQRIHKEFDIPSVFVTGLTDPETRARIVQVNPLELLPKPLTSMAITAALQNASERLR